jgi:WD40 repeat protein
VSNDGDRIVIRAPFSIVVFEKKPRGAPSTSRRFVVVDREETNGLNSSPNNYRLLPDGKTFIDVSLPPNVRIWDVSRDPDLVVADNYRRAFTLIERDGRTWRQVTTGDGRFSLEWPAPAETSFKLISNSTGPIVVRDADGKELGQLPDPAGFSYFTAEFLAESRRLLVQYTLTSAEPDPTPRSNVTLRRWRIYDLEKGFRLIDSGTGVLNRLPNVPVLLETLRSPEDGSPQHVLLDPYAVLRDARTGELIRRVEFPDRYLRFCGFDPSGQKYLVLSAARAPTAVPRPRQVRSPAELAVVGGAFAGNPGFTSQRGQAVRDPVTDPRNLQAFRVHLFERATGNELWSHEITAEFHIPAVGETRFTPDGQRVLLRYETSAPRTFGNRQVVSLEKDRVWVADINGRVEHDLVVLEQSRTELRSFDLGSRPFRFAELTLSPDGRHVAVAGVGVVEIWDHESGTMTHRLTGHAGTNRAIGVAYNADGSRLFTRDAQNAGLGGPNTAGVTVHVWDTTTGRELLTLTTPAVRIPGLSVMSGFEFQGEKLYSKGPLFSQVLDGSPVKP